MERAEKRYAQAKARLLALKNRAATAARKMDTRRKVILGGALVDLAGRDATAAAMLDRLVRNLPREQDRKAFVGWTPGGALPEDGAADGAEAGGGASSAAVPAEPARGA
nr:mobilization protein [Rubellimicrobium aerolatum]